MGGENKKRKVKISGVLLLLGIFVAIIGIIYIIVALPKNINATKTLYNYQIKKNSSHVTNLKEESIYYYDSLIGESSSYPSLSIKNMNLNFTYFFAGNELINSDYTYNITADIIGNYTESSGTEQVWEKKFTLTENKTINLEKQKSFAINENTIIDYNLYNDLVRQFKEVYNLQIQAKLRVRLNVSYSIKDPENNFNDIQKSDFVEVEIPLTETITTVKNNYQPLTEDSITETIVNKPDYIILSIGMFFILLSIILFIIANNKKVVTKYSLYKKNMEKVMKDYGDLIVTVKNRPSIKNLRLMALTNIDDLVDVAEQNKCNIINYEIPKKYESFLLVIVEGYVYVYVITEEEIIYSNK